MRIKAILQHFNRDMCTILHFTSAGKVFCASCSSNSIPLPRYGQMKPVRVCEECFQHAARHGRRPNTPHHRWKPAAGLEPPNSLPQLCSPRTVTGPGPDLVATSTSALERKVNVIESKNWFQLCNKKKKITPCDVYSVFAFKRRYATVGLVIPRSCSTGEPFSPILPLTDPCVSSWIELKWFPSSICNCRFGSFLLITSIIDPFFEVSSWK